MEVLYYNVNFHSILACSQRVRDAVSSKFKILYVTLGKCQFQARKAGPIYAGATPPPHCYVPKTSTRPNFSAFVRNIWDTIASLLSVYIRSYETCRSNAVLGQEHMLLDLRGLNDLYSHYPLFLIPLCPTIKK